MKWKKRIYLSETGCLLTKKVRQREGKERIEKENRDKNELERKT